MDRFDLSHFKSENVTFKYLNKNDIPMILAFQDENTTPDVFVKITNEEFTESVEKDYVIGAYNENELVGFCLMIVNRETDRNLAPDIKESCIDTATFDAVVVSKSFRGHALQKRFINLSCEIAKTLNPKPRFMSATVSPDNFFSKRNFLQSGFIIKDKKEKYGGNMRLVVAKEI